MDHGFKYETIQLLEKKKGKILETRARQKCADLGQKYDS